MRCRYPCDRRVYSHGAPSGHALEQHCSNVGTRSDIYFYAETLHYFVIEASWRIPRMKYPETNLDPF